MSGEEAAMVGETHQRLISQLASVLSTLRDVDSLPERLCEAGRQMLAADGAAITLSTPAGVRVPICATDGISARLQDLEDVVDQGPTVDAVQTGTMLIERFGEGGEERWPMMSEHGARLGFTGTLIAVPLVVDQRVIGALSAHRQPPERTGDRDIGAFLGVALATALLQEPSLSLEGVTASGDWPSRAQLHQATGMIVAQVGVHPHDALALLKGQAFAQGTTLPDIAEQIIQRRINFRDFTIEGD
ncbi:MAG: hypothetical protein JWR55_1051 [Aeromicrobium sp.]|nr:hypothetical protein [Aeromicrobium sp.]